MRSIETIATACIAVLCAGCGGDRLAPVPEYRSDEWYKEVDDIVGISDALGHGPDYGSEEWCRAVHRHLSFELAPLTSGDAGSEDWYRQVNEAVFWLRRTGKKPDRRYSHKFGGVALELEVWEPAGTTPVRRFYRITAREEGKPPIAVTRRDDNRIVNHWVTDLNGNQEPEIVLATQSFGSGAYGYITIYEWTGQELREAIMLTWYLVPDGYMGHNEIDVQGNEIVRTFPVYRKGDSNSNPTGGRRQARYRYTIGGIGRIQ